MKQKLLTADLSKKARIMELAGDATRIRILCALFEHRNICVSDMAESLNMSVAAISHHLQLLYDYGIVATERKGKRICYSFKETPLIKHIRQFICHKSQSKK